MIALCWGGGRGHPAIWIYMLTGIKEKGTEMEEKVAYVICNLIIGIPTPPMTLSSVKIIKKLKWIKTD